MRGVCYIVWGKTADAVLERSLASLARFHPELPVHVVRLENVGDPIQALLEKSRMFDLSPFESTLFLDADTVVLDRLDYGFEKAEQFGLACVISESPWGRRSKGLHDAGDIVEYNTGVLFFSHAAKPVFDAWKALTPVIDSTMPFVTSEGEITAQPYHDQAAFAKAIETTRCVPFVLPLNWNFRPHFYRSFFGPIKVWHDYLPPPADIVRLGDYYRKPQSVIQFHVIEVKSPKTVESIA